MVRPLATLPVDLTILRAATDNGAINEVLLIYRREGSKIIKKLRAAVKRKDREGVAKLAHRFLGSSRFVGATEITAPLASLSTISSSPRLWDKASGLIEQTANAFILIERYFVAHHG